MPKDVKSINAINFMRAIEQRHGPLPKVTQPLFDQYGAEYINDPNTWTEMGPIVEMFRRYLETLGTRHPKVIEEAGVLTAKLRSVGPLEHLVRFVPWPRIAFANVPAYNRHFNNIFEMDTYNVAAQSGTILVRYTPRRDDGWYYEQCWWNRGILASIPLLWDLPAATCEERLCFYTPQKIAECTGLALHVQGDALCLGNRIIGEQITLGTEVLPATRSRFMRLLSPQYRRAHEVHRVGVGQHDGPRAFLLKEDLFLEGKLLIKAGVAIGAPYCRYEFTWQAKPFVRNLYDMSLGRVKELARMSRALEEQLRYTQQQFAELERQREHERLLERLMTGGFAHEIRNKLTGANLETRQVQDEHAFDEMRAALTQLMKAFIALEGQTLSRAQVADRLVPHLRSLSNRTAQLERLLANVTSDIHLALAVTDQIRNYAKMQELARGTEDIDVVALANSYRQTYGTMLEKQGISYTVRATGPHVIRGEVSQLNSILENLVKNAIEALTDAPVKAVTVSISAVERSGARYVRIVVHDTGHGIAPEHQAKIFYPFYSTKPDMGTGLGLSVARRMVELYKGTIECVSDPGQGTTFTVDLWTSSNG